MTLLHLLAVLVDVKQRNAPDVHAQQHLDVLVRQVAAHLAAERLEALLHGGEDGFVGAGLLDFLVNAFFDENADQRFEMQFLLQLVSPSTPVPA